MISRASSATLTDPRGMYAGGATPVLARRSGDVHEAGRVPSVCDVRSAAPTCRLRHEGAPSCLDGAPRISFRRMSLRATFRIASAVAATLPVLLTAQASSPTLPPTLVVQITVDQLRPDYFERFASQLTGGLGRLYRHGAFFANATHDHATVSYTHLTLPTSDLV